MKATHYRIILASFVLFVSLLLPLRATAHCDTMDGPVVTAAKLALQIGDVTPVLRWVHSVDEPQIRVAFEHTLKVRTLSPEARELADHYFFETLVRIHRASEGEPYTGLKPAGTEIEPGIALADKSLETGSADALIRQVTAEMATNLRQRFSQAQATSRGADRSVASGRRYVAAYVEFIHYVESLHEAIAGQSAHAQHEEDNSNNSQP